MIAALVLFVFGLVLLPFLFAGAGPWVGIAGVVFWGWLMIKFATSPLG